jgi:hypothetical protein
MLGRWSGKRNKNYGTAVDAACHFWNACHRFASHGALGVPCCCSYRITVITIIIIIFIVTIMPSSTLDQLTVTCIFILSFNQPVFHNSAPVSVRLYKLSIHYFPPFKTLVTAGFRFSSDSKYVSVPLYSPHAKVFCDPSQAFHLGRCDPTFVLGDYLRSFNEGSRRPKMSTFRNLVLAAALLRPRPPPPPPRSISDI